MTTSIDWQLLLGLELENSKLTSVLTEIVPSHQSTKPTNSTKNTKTYDFFDDGLSFYFVDDKLDSIDFYSRSKRFKQVRGSLPLPHGITLGFTGKDFVAKFGEPLEKGGGNSSKLDIWLRWEHLQVELDDKSWDLALNAVWTSFTIF